MNYEIIGINLQGNNKNKNPPKKMKSLNKLRSSNSNTKHNTTIKKSTKISIDAEADKVKSGTSEKKNKTINQGNKIIFHIIIK